VASTAARQLATERHSGALEVVLSTPLSVPRILWGEFLALGRKFLGPILAVLGVHLIFLAASLQRESFADNPVNPTLWVVSMIVLVADLVALGWVAMWGAMTFKNPNRVTTITLVRVLTLPWVLVIVLELLGAPMFPWEVNVGLWFSASLLVDLGLSFAAWWQLRNGFRQFACSRFVPLPSLFSVASLRKRFG
jgi:ABC-type Na+ efflux pump permease subunit